MASRQHYQGSERLETDISAGELQQTPAHTENSTRSGMLSPTILSKVAHELRTPLQAIVGYTSGLLEGIYGPVDDTQKEKLLIVDRNATHLNSLIDELSMLSRLESGSLAVLKEDVDIVPILESVYSQYKDDLVAKNVESRFQCCDKGVFCRTDPEKLREIVRQLVSNAAKFTVRGAVTISLDVEGTDAVILVQDTSGGMPSDYLQHVLDLFRDKGDPMAHAYGGPGLGLSLAKKLLDLLGGTVEVRSEANRGTAVTVRLPEAVTRVDEYLQPNGRQCPPLPPLPSRVLDALVVDDDQYSVDLLTDFLERYAGCRVRKAYSGLDAQLHLTERRPDYLFVDLLLPQMNGERILQYCERLWAVEPVTMIIMTAKTLTEEETSKLKKRAATVLRKGMLRTEILYELLSPVIPLRVRS